jgi:hypothetical protein
MTLTRRQFLARSGALAGALALPAVPAFGSTSLRKMIDIGPGGVISPGSAQDYRAYSNRTYFAETQTGWIRMWADWPSLQPDGRYRIDEPASPGYAKLQALDAQIRQACADGLRVMLMSYRHPRWVNGTAALVPNSDAEISFQYADRMSAAAWSKYLAAGRNAAAYNPSRRALEYRVPPEGYPLDGAWSKFFEFLMRRYHYGQRSSGRYVWAFELVNEPNYQLWPQIGIAPAIARLMKTAEAVSARVGHTTGMYAPSCSDTDTGSRIVTRYDDFATALLDAFPAVGYLPHSRQAWSHHNYLDVEGRTTVRLQALQARLAGRWKGLVEGSAPTVFMTEGGARVAKMKSLYPAEDPLAAQAKSLATAWSLHNAAPGVSMLAQYLLYADPNYDCGLLDAAPATVKRPSYATWKSFPKRV